MEWQKRLQELYPGAVPQEVFIRETYTQLAQRGLNASSTIACVAVCRDEMTRPLSDTIGRCWGEAFNFGSLAGMLLLGRTGFQAALHHSPLVDGRARYVFFGLTHLGLGPTGEIGVVARRGQPGPSHACGALCAALKDLETGERLYGFLDEEDLELSLVKRRLMRERGPQDPLDLRTLTRLSYQAIVNDFEQLCAKQIDPTRADHALLTGIELHVAEGPSWIWPGRLTVTVQGVREELKLG